MRLDISLDQIKTISSTVNKLVLEIEKRENGPRDTSHVGAGGQTDALPLWGSIQVHPSQLVPLFAFR